MKHNLPTRESYSLMCLLKKKKSIFLTMSTLISISLLISGLFSLIHHSPDIPVLYILLNFTVPSSVPLLFPLSRMPFTLITAYMFPSHHSGWCTDVTSSKKPPLTLLLATLFHYTAFKK